MQAEKHSGIPAEAVLVARVYETQKLDTAGADRIACRRQLSWLQAIAAEALCTAVYVWLADVFEDSQDSLEEKWGKVGLDDEAMGIVKDEGPVGTEVVKGLFSNEPIVFYRGRVPTPVQEIKSSKRCVLGNEPGLLC